MHQFDYVVHETERQSGTMREAVGMYHALTMFNNHYKAGYRINWALVQSAVRAINGVSQVRKVPAVFNQGTAAVPPGELLTVSLGRWNDTVNSSQSEVTTFSTNLFNTSGEIADFLTREFLLIHPFTDGNGRVGSLIWNFLNGSIGSPEPMPYFFGEN